MKRSPSKTPAISLDCPKGCAKAGTVCNDKGVCKARTNLAVKISHSAKYGVTQSQAVARSESQRKQAGWHSWRLRRCYGLTPSEFEAMLTEQHNQCAVCNDVLDASHIDHDHNTNKIRGVLCGMCNVAIAHFRDNATAMLRAAAYIRNNGFSYTTVAEHFIPDAGYLAKINKGGSGSRNKGSGNRSKKSKL